MSDSNLNPRFNPDTIAEPAIYVNGATISILVDGCARLSFKEEINGFVHYRANVLLTLKALEEIANLINNVLAQTEKAKSPSH